MGGLIRLERGMAVRVRPGGSGIHLLLAAVLFTAGSPEACTSFADYSTGGAWYGMNFDWPPSYAVLFRVETDRIGNPVFTMAFVQGADTTSTVGMTADGRFSTMQVTDEPCTGPDPESGNPYIYTPFHALVYGGASLGDLGDMAGNDTFVQYDNPPLHVIAADTAGSAMIIEVGEDGNDIVEIGDGPFLVMTNFDVSRWAGADPAVIDGDGADRYRAALYMLKDSLGRMDAETGFAVLEASRSNSADFPTRASMVFDASHGVVYLAVEGDFSRIWRLDVHTGVLEGWRGLPSAARCIPGPGGITTASLGSGG